MRTRAFDPLRWVFYGVITAICFGVCNGLLSIILDSRP